jgi:hypothetical protein
VEGSVLPAATSTAATPAPTREAEAEVAMETETKAAEAVPKRLCLVGLLMDLMQTVLLLLQ